MRSKIAFALALATLVAAGIARAQAPDQDPQEPRLSPALAQLRETVADRLHAAADKLGLNAEQRAKIKEIHATFAPKCQAQREARKALRQEEFQALAAILTPEQREKVKAHVEERVAEIREGAASRTWPEVSSPQDSITERLMATADEVGITPEQRTQLRESLRPYFEKYRAQAAERRELIEQELKAVDEVLTPAQKQMVRRYVEGRALMAKAAMTVADRLRTASGKLALTDAQKTKLAETRESYADQFRTMRRERHELLRSEMKAIADVLTPEQREKVRDFCDDRVVVVGIEVDPANPPHLAELRETVAGRLRAAADKLGLSEEQRTKIKDIHAHYKAQYEAQRTTRRALRQKEFQAFGDALTPEQRDAVKDFLDGREDVDQDG